MGVGGRDGLAQAADATPPSTSRERQSGRETAVPERHPPPCPLARTVRGYPLKRYPIPGTEWM